MGSEINQRLADLSPAEIKELVRKLHGASDSGPDPARMPRNPEGRYPLSSAQERMWFLCQLSPGSTAFNNPGALRARSTVPLDLELLGRSVRQVARSHEILRTTFHSEGGRPFQLVHDELPPAYEWRDLTHVPADEREAEVRRLALEEGRQAFDLTTGPLLAFKVLRLDELEYVLLITTHHIVSDGWTNAMLAPEIAAVYGRLVQGGDAEATGPERQYVDYVHWEREWLESEEAADQMAYWKERLARDVPLALPTDRPRPPVMTRKGGLETHRLAPDLAARLRELARVEKVSLFHLLNAGFAALLHRYTGQETITLGTQTANRNRREFQSVMGLFANTVALRTEVDPDRPFREHLRRVADTCREALARQELPFEHLIGELNPPRTLNRHPLFQVMHVHQNVPRLYQVPEMEVEVLKIDYGTSKFDLNLWTEEIDDELALTLHYSRDLFEPVTVRRWLRHYQGLLESALNDPDRAVGELALEPAPVGEAPGAESASELPTSRDEPSPPFHRAFEARARAHPEAPAVEADDGALSAGELNRRANRLARHLRDLGVAPGESVGLLAERGSRTMVAILAVLKAGGAYVAMDPGTPVSRMEAVLGVAGARFLLVEKGLTPLPEAVAKSVTPVVLEEAEARASDLEDGDLTDVLVGAEDPIYVVFTSGTTGEPKGVCVEHRHLMAYAKGIWDRMGLSPGDRFATVTSLAADLGNTMIFPPLAFGGVTVLVPDTLATDPPGLAEWLQAHPVDCLKIVPSHLSALLSAREAREILPRKLLILGGEACSSRLVARVRELAPELRIMNHYGPSETTVGVLSWEVPEEGPLDGPVPLGRPLPGVRVEILDRAGGRVPPGVPGEIHVAGPTVARGYLGRPELTAERFIEDPLEAGERLYRTGDRGRFREDGAILFLGRTDRQVKVRGYRVELEEVERAAEEHPSVAEAVAPPFLPGEGAQVTLYVRPVPGTSPGARELREYLAARLPSYMVPGPVGFVEAVPLTGNGKVDYRALPELKPGSEGPSSTPPRDAVELALTRIWSELLGVESLGIDDDFFALGGHSLLAVRVMARIHEELDCRLGLASLFEHGTIRNLARLVRNGAGEGAGSPLVVVRPGGDGAPRVFVHPAGGNVLCYYELSRELEDGAPFWALQSVGPTASSGDHTVSTLAEAYLGALLERPFSGVPVLGGWSMGALVAFEMARAYARARGDLPTVLILDQRAPGIGSRESQPWPGSGEVARLAAFAGKVGELVGEDLELSAEVLEEAGPEERTALFLDRFKRFQLAPETTRPEEFRGFLDLMLAHNRMTESYTAEPYPGRVVLFRAREARGDADPGDLGWSRLAPEGLEVASVPGSHVSMMRAPHVADLAREIDRALRD